VRWNKIIADVKLGYWSTMAPLVVRNHVITGVGGDLDNLPGLLRAFDPETGEVQWGVGSHTADRNSKRHDRRYDVDDRHVRSGTQSPVLGQRGIRLLC